jgi:hypothetical protein
MSIDSDRLPRFEEMNSAENSPALSMVARLRRVMSPPIRLDLEHVGALVGEEHGCERSRHHAGPSADAFEWT